MRKNQVAADLYDLPIFVLDIKIFFTNILYIFLIVIPIYSSSKASESLLLLLACWVLKKVKLMLKICVWPTRNLVFA